MAKAIKTIGIVVGVVALVATGVGVAMGGLTAAASVAGSSAAFGATLMTVGTIASVAAGLIGVATAVFAPKPKFSSEGNPLQFQTNPQSGLPYCIGRTRMSGLRIHADTYDAIAYKSEGKQDVLTFAVLLSAGGAVEGPLTFRADKETVAFNASTGMATGSYSTWMAQKLSLGLAGASALALAFGGGNFPGWTSAHKLSGMSHALWDLRFDPKGEKFGAGVPVPEWIGKWVKVYDPRKDSTYPGGSGSHRALNESTYEWSANPALHALTWALGRWQNGKRTLGIGAPVANIRVADFVEAANVADANSWTCGGVEWSTDNKWSIMKRMLQAGGAEPTMTGAMIGCRVNTPRVSIATVTADKLLDNASFPATRSRRDRFNTVIPRYRSEDHDWEVISGAPIQVASYVTADGGPRTKEIDFPLVQHETGGNGNEQAGQLAAYEIVNSREAGPWRFTVGPEYIGVKTGDVITLDAPDEGIAAQPVLVRSRSIDPATFKITFEVETETSSKHDFALGKTAVPPPTYTPTPPDLTPPTPSVALWSLGAEVAGGLVPALRVAGVSEFPGADSVLIEYRVVGATDWQSGGSFDAGGPVDHIISPVEGSTTYEARIAYKSGQRLGGWLTLTSVTTAAISSEQLAKQVRLAPSVAQVPADSSGAITSYANAQFDFIIELEDGTDVSSNFALTTDSNPAGLDGDIVGNHVSIDSGFSKAESPALLTMKATGSGDYAGVIFRRTFTLFADQTGFMLAQIQAANNNNGETPSDDITITNVALKTTHPDGRVTYTADVAWTYNSDPADPDNFDDLVWCCYSSTSSTPVTLGGVAAPLVGERGGRQMVNLTSSPQKLEILTEVDPTRYYTIGYQKIRLVNTNVAAKGYIVGPVTQIATFRPSSVQNIANAQINGTAASTVATGAARANAGLDGSGNVSKDIPTGIKIGGSTGLTASAVSDGATRANTGLNSSGLVVQPIPITTRIGGSLGATASDVSNAAVRSLSGLLPTGEVNTSKVIDGSISIGVINRALYYVHITGSLIGNNTDTSEVSGVGQTVEVSSNGELLLTGSIPYAMRVTNPTLDQMLTARFYLACIITGGSWNYSGYTDVSDKWEKAAAIGTFTLGTRTVVMRHKFTGLTPGSYRIGYRVITGVSNGVELPRSRYFDGSNTKAME